MVYAANPADKALRMQLLTPDGPLIRQERPRAKNTNEIRVFR
jgi:hypothetical protein